MANLWHLSADADGRSRIDHLALPLTAPPSGYVVATTGETREPHSLRRVANPLGASGVQLGRLGPGYDGGWHNTPEGSPMLVAVLGPGTIEMETSDGWRHRFSAGDVLLSADYTGEGHRTIVVGDDVVSLLYISLIEGAEGT